MANLDEQVWQRAKKLWHEAGRPDGGADSFIDQASELVAIEDNPTQATRPLKASERGTPEEAAAFGDDDAGPTGEPIEPIVAIENAGEFPTMTDQGEEQVPHRAPESERQG